MEYVHLTTPQQNIWNLQKYYGDSAIANICGAVFFHEKRNSSLLQQAVRMFIRNQSGLRLQFADGTKIKQCVSEKVDEILVMEFATMDEFDSYAEELAKTPLGLVDRVMYRFVVFQVGNQSGILAVLSHLISDAWTFGLMANQVDVAYHILSGETDASLLKGDYTEYVQSEAMYVNSEKYLKDKIYWEEKYAKQPEKTAVKICPATPTAIAAKRITKVLSAALEKKIDEFCRASSVTQAVLFETALLIYLSKINPENASVTIGIPVLNRSNVKEKHIAGMFVSTMPLTVSIEENDTVRELSEKITKEHRDIFRHQKYPYAAILKSLREKQNFQGNLYDVMISYQNARTDTGAETKWYSNGASEVPLVLHIDNRDSHECHTLNVDYQTEVFHSEKEVYCIINRLEYILEQMVENKDKSINDIKIVPEKEWNQIIYDFNDTYIEYPREKCIHELFTEQAAKTPDRIALVFEDKKFTYKELDEMSNSLAHFLREKGIKANDKIAVFQKRDEKVVITQLAVLKLGAVFIPIDSRYPKERIEYILLQSNAKLILKNKTNSMTFINECVIEECKYDEKQSPISEKVNANDICYIIFTSGSTGQPKGCTLTNRGVVNFCKNCNILDACNHLEHQVCISVNTISFDFFIAESLLPLLNGYTVVLASEEESTNQEKFAEAVKGNQVNIIQTTPTRHKLYFNEQMDLSYAQQFEVIVTAGETLPLDLLKKFREYTNAKIFNPLGPSECSVWVAGGELDLSNKEISVNDITIGSPIANTQLYILDKQNNPLPIGVAGELCIAGDGVGKGYLNRPDLTAEKFVPNPFAAENNHHGKIMYHTGDLARWREDGEIEYLGRMDTQVKIRGLRIELGEIEAVMSSFEGIGLTAVADKRDESNRQYLVGYYTADEEIEEKELRQYLSQKLPKYMVPNYFVHLHEMPMTPSGKMDRKNLPVPDFSVAVREYIPCETDTEKRLAIIWQELLHLDKIGKTEDFFELGGDSLLAISMLNEMQDIFHVDISMNNIMENASIGQLASYIDKAHSVIHIPAYHENKYVLLPQQKAIYAVYSKNPNTLAYNMPARIPLPQSMDREKLEKCIHQVFALHKLLKSHFMAEGNEIYGIYDEDVEIVFEEYKNDKTEGFIRPFDLAHAPLVRVGFTEDALLIDLHHIVADGESLNILLKDILSAYEGQSLDERKVEYSDYSRYFYRMDTTEHKAYFKEMLKCDFVPVTLPETKKPKQGGKSKVYEMPEDIFLKTKNYAKDNGLTDTMVFLAAYGIMLSKYTANTDILSSIIMRNRIHADAQNIVGMFVNTLPVYLRAEGDTKEYFKSVKKLMMNLFHYQELPFWDIANAVGMKDKTVVNTSFVYQGDGEKTLTLDGEKMIPQIYDTNTAKFDLSMELTPKECGCKIRMEYNREKYDEQLMDKLVKAYMNILKQLHKEKLSDISVLSEEEYQKVIYDFNDTYIEYPREKCVHELFTEQAAKTPDRIALVFEDKKFTYKELDEMSNSLAHFLREKGIKANDIVPIIAKRSWHVIVAMLGILKAGGAYMPVDSSYPVDRIGYMLNETKAKLVLAYSWNKEIIGYNLIDLESVDYFRNTDGMTNVNNATDLAYVLFTSGSTGKPKATLISHTNLGNFIDNNRNNKYQCVMINTCKVVLADTIFTFDISVFEIYLSLLNGLTVVLTKEMSDAKCISGLVEKYEVDVIHTTPTKMMLLLRNDNFQKAVARVKMLMIGAETFTEELYQTITKYTNAVIYNGYGPTETTIGCSFKRVKHSVWNQNGSAETHVATNSRIKDFADITIGSPIANTQLYILDKQNNPLPLGVAGELCIAGDGVGKGYLNRPELTAEKFVPNPFASESNHHGKIMYHTGDLARWREDGEIEYLGRIDTQVKIRGLRIELGEIESVMSSFEGIGLTAVADKRDENNRQYLVGYYTSDEAIDEKKLRQHLSQKLPKYMVPNYFVQLHEMPMTPSGKTDRKNLPVPEFAVAEQEYIAPETEQEIVLCHLLEDILHMDRVGVEDDFFLYGGDSLGAIEYVARAHELGVEIALQNVFDYPTVRGLCNFLNSGIEKKVQYEHSDLAKYEKIFAGNVIDDSFVPERKSLGNVLLTGATGFLGAHVLHELMREENGKIYCLVRSNADHDRRGRIQEILKFYFGEKYEYDFGKRIIPIVGDIEKEGLSEHMPDDVQTVIHTAASVKHYGSYDYFHKVNVEGTQHVIDYVKTVGAKLIHVSTLSVSGNSMADDFSVYRSEDEKHFYESSFYIGQPLDNVYIHSKFEAEKRVYDAMLEGLDAKVIRVGNLTNRTGDYRFQPNYKENAFLTRVKAILEFGRFPDYLMPLYAEFSPVDLTAEGIVKIVKYADKQTVFHLNSNRPIYFDRFLDVVHNLGISMKIVDGDTFNQELQKTIKNTETEYIFEAFQNDMDENGHLVYDSNIRIENDFTLWFLKKVGFEWKETDMEYISGYIEYFRKLGYLEV